MGTRMVGMGEVEEGTIPASLPATPLCTLLFPPPPPPPPPFSSSSSSFPPQQQQQQRPSQNGTLLHPSSSPAHNSSSPSPSPSLAGSPRTLPRKSPALGSSSGGLSSPAPSATLNASSTAAAGAGAGAGAGEGIDFSTLVTLWELLLLGEPILVWSGDPRTGSEAVEGLKALIKPVRLSPSRGFSFNVTGCLSFSHPHTNSTRKSWPALCHPLHHPSLLLDPVRWRRPTLLPRARRRFRPTLQTRCKGPSHSLSVSLTHTLLWRGSPVPEPRHTLGEKWTIDVFRRSPTPTLSHSSRNRVSCSLQQTHSS